MDPPVRLRELDVSLAVVILAAGQGTRMKSGLPKVLHRAAGRPMLEHVLLAARTLEPERIVIVTGHGADDVEVFFANSGVTFARQHEQLGTAHAFKQAIPALEGFHGEILVLYGDTPMLKSETLKAALEQHLETKSGMTVLTADVDNPSGYGRIMRDSSGQVLKIVEEKGASVTEKTVKEINSGVYAFSSRALELVHQIGSENAAKEFYLTDILELYRKAGDGVRAYKSTDPTELEGVNDRVQLAAADKVLRDRIRDRWLRSGVTMIDPATTYIDDTVTLEPDVILSPNVFLEGTTSIGRGSSIGPNSRILDSTLEPNVTVHGWTVIQESYVSSNADVGPFARFRPNVRLEAGAHVGNFVELKNTTMGPGAKAGHLAYLGDSDIGAEVNIGAGTITANYDGLGKYKTRIGAGTFIGSNSVIVAPREIGETAYVAAGSVVTEDIQSGDLAVARGRQRNFKDWSLKFWRKGLENVGLDKFPFIRGWLKGRGTSSTNSASED